MNSEKSYDSLPNFTAADCKYCLVALLLSVSGKQFASGNRFASICLPEHKHEMEAVEAFKERH